MLTCSKISFFLFFNEVSLEEMVTSGGGAAASNLTAYDEAAVCSGAFR